MRLASIDILRAITMTTMLWVNDFWTLKGIPKWLKHAKGNEDYLGFSDIVFPLFLFIVGMSIPLAVQSRITKGASQGNVLWHILVRSASLLFIGFFMVNYENIFADGLPINNFVWCILMGVGVFLIWTNWKRTAIPIRFHLPLQIVGFLLFGLLAFIYRGGESGQQGMAPHWWGILGLIGWAYCINAIAYILSKGNLMQMVLLWLIFIALSILSHSGVHIPLGAASPYLETIVSGTLPAFTAGGMVAILLFQKLITKSRTQTYWALVFLGILCIVFGLATRPLWGISKLMATPSWLGVCTGIGLLLFVLIHYIADVKKIINWAKILMPAGTATFTCYMLPYFIYSVYGLTHLKLPDVLNTGIIGLLGSLVYALLVVRITGWMERKNIKLKL